MTANTPTVSIGLPVYNGERYLEEAILSILAQTFGDFELIILDNASTDGTEGICRRYAAKDKRVRYTRNPENIGLFPNFNRVFELASGTYFKWAAHDDVCRPEFIERCVEALELDPGIVCSYPRVLTIDAEGHPTTPAESRPEFESTKPHHRFRESLLLAEPHAQAGLARTAALRKTQLFGAYPLADLVLLAELTLHGRFHEVPEHLFLHREHPARSVRAHNWRDPHSDITWLDPGTGGKLIFPQWRLFGGHLSAIYRAPIGLSERLRCYAELGPWLRGCQHELFRDAIVAAERLPILGKMLATSRRRHAQRSWERSLRRAREEIVSLVPAGHAFILVDDGTFGIERLDGRRAIPFIERDGQYLGSPARR